MRVFVTGASGWIGSVTLPELISHGHAVLALARSDASAAKLSSLGASVQVLRGEITDLETLKKGASECDGVIHLAFVHDFTDYIGSCAKDAAAIQAMASVLEGTDKPFVITGGTMMAPHNQLATEDDAADISNQHGRARSENEITALALKEKGIRVSTIRLSPSVHGKGDPWFMKIIIDLAKAKGVAAFVGEGRNVWPGIHRKDAAVLYRLALESAPAGTRVHAVENDGYAWKDIAGVIGRKHGLKVESKTPEEAREHFEWLAGFMMADNPTSNKLTRERFGWEPKEIGLLEDIEKNY